jgi:acyl-CoA thioesterase FadM
MSHLISFKQSIILCFIEGERILAAKAEVTVVAFDEQAYQKTELPFQLLETLKRLKAKAQT